MRGERRDRVEVSWDVGDARVDAIGDALDAHPRLAVRFEHRLLDEEDPVIAREARHQVLGALEGEAPAQVREADEVTDRSCLAPRPVCLLEIAHHGR